jgi:hypothetical protein
LTATQSLTTIKSKGSDAMTIACRDPKANVVVEIEPAAVWALLDESYRTVKVWEEWELPHQARAPLRLIVQSPPATAGVWLRLYRIELRCEQAEALRQRCDELGDVLEQMPNQPDRDTGAALKRAARSFYEAIRFSRRERSPR